MAPRKKDEKLIDPYTLISKRYFSVISRKNHNTDLYHDKANLFPEFSAFEKPCCSVAHEKHEDHSFPNNTVIKDIAKKYLPPVPSKTSSMIGTRSQSLAPATSGAALLEREKQKSSTTKNSKKVQKAQEDAPSPSNKPRESRANSVDQLVDHKASVVCKKPYKNIVEGGQIMLEKSRQIMEEMATPVELIERIRSQKRAESTQLKTDKDKIERLAKRLDLSMKAHDHDDTKKVFRFLAQIPMDYYKKARDLKTGNRPRKESQHNKSQEESSPLSGGVARGRRVRRRQAVCEIYTKDEQEEQEQQQPELEQQKSGATLSPIENDSSKQIETEMSPLHIPRERSFDGGALSKDEKITGTGIARREKRLFLTPLSGMTTYLQRGGMWQEDKLSNLFSSKGAKLTRSKTRGSDILSVYMDGQEPFQSTAPISRRVSAGVRDDKEAWLEKVKIIKEGVNNYLGQDKSFLNLYQDEINSKINDIDTSVLDKDEEEEQEEQETKDFEGDYEKEDQDKIIFEAKNRDPEVYVILKQTLKGKSGSSAKNEANRETINFYKKIALKEKRKADGLMAAPKAEKSKNSSKNAGRDIFNIQIN